MIPPIRVTLGSSGTTGYVARQATAGVILLDMCWRILLLYAPVFTMGYPVLGALQLVPRGLRGPCFGRQTKMVEFVEAQPQRR